MESSDLKERREYLQSKLAALPAGLSDFIEMGKNIGENFNFSLESLDGVENLLIQLSPDFTDEENSALYEDCWVYIGETYRKFLHGAWSISDEEEYNPLYFGLPVIDSFNPYDDEICPMVVIDVLMEKKNPGLLKEQIEQYLIQ